MRVLLVAASAVALFLTSLATSVLAQERGVSSNALPTCSARTLPTAEKAAMEREYAQRTREDGKAKADAWLQREARVLVARLVDQGICTMPGSGGEQQTAQRPQPSDRTRPVGKSGSTCKTTRLENRNVANPSGGPMMMVLVPVCAD